MDNFKSQFLLDPEITYLNHGSFGACPKPVFEIYQKWQRELERQPVEFLGRRIKDLLFESRQRLGEYLGVDAQSLVYYPNPTTAINMVARCLSLEPGDEILTTNHEYGAMDRIWRFICRKTGASYHIQPIEVPVTSAEKLVEELFSGVTMRTKAIFISHVTSPTALIFPVQTICKKAREMGILTIVDGAHAPGQIDLDLKTINADIYVGACHKWLCAPKGSAFLYANPSIQDSLEPLIVSWGFESDKPGPSRFIDYHEWQGTRDLAAFLAVPAAIEFQNNHNWPLLRQQCHELASSARARMNAVTNCPSLSPDSHSWFSQMVSVILPNPIQPDALQSILYDRYRIEVPLFIWNDIPVMRISIQVYNCAEDIDYLVSTLSSLL